MSHPAQTPKATAAAPTVLCTTDGCNQPAVGDGPDKLPSCAACLEDWGLWPKRTKPNGCNGTGSGWCDCPAVDV